jgi:hydroxymethylpyrimidine pyrophosphatase-like HAD family hydrolase
MAPSQRTPQQTVRHLSGFRNRPRDSASPLVAFVTDFDRTLQRPGGRPTQAARGALRTARALGLRTILVSGREYVELGRLARGFGRWDALVAEDGAVVEAPRGSPPKVFGRRAAVEIRRRLTHHPKLQGDWGEVVYSLARGHRRRLVRMLSGLPVHVTANVDRLMVVPAGVNKLTGVRVALRQLGLGNRPYAAIGDAENDVEMLKGAALSGTVGNGRPEVRRVADYIAVNRFDRGVREFAEGPLRAWVESGPVPPLRRDARPGRGPAPR